MFPNIQLLSGAATADPPAAAAKRRHSARIESWRLRADLVPAAIPGRDHARTPAGNLAPAGITGADIVAVAVTAEAAAIRRKKSSWRPTSWWLLPRKYSAPSNSTPRIECARRSVRSRRSSDTHVPTATAATTWTPNRKAKPAKDVAASVAAAVVATHLLSETYSLVSLLVGVPLIK